MATRTTSIALGDKLTEYTRRKVASGEFGSASEVIRDALRRAAERDAQRDALDRELQKGLDSGPARAFDWNAFMERKFGPAE